MPRWCRIGGAFIQGLNSVDTGVKIGVILFCGIAIGGLVMMRFKPARKPPAVDEEAGDGSLTSLDKLLGSSE